MRNVHPFVIIFKVYPSSLNWVQLYNAQHHDLLVLNLFGVLHHVLYLIGYMVMGSWKSSGNQYTHLVKVLDCKLLTNSKKLPASSWDSN